MGSWAKQRLCLSKDDGQTWQVFPDLVDRYEFFAWHPQDPKVVYVGTRAGGLRSDDGGKTWKPIAKPIRAIFASNGDIIYSLTSLAPRRFQVQRSQDRGKSWIPLGQNIRGAVADIDVGPTNPDDVYAAGNGGIWVYHGESWSRRDEADGLERDFFGAMNFRAIAVDPRRPNVIYAGQWSPGRGVGHGIFRSTDYGRTWKNINGNFGPELTVWAVTVSPHDSTAWLGTDHGNWRLAVTR